MKSLARIILLLLLVSVLAARAIGDEKQHPIAALPEPRLPTLVPATVPGPALAHAELLAGVLPRLKQGDGSTIADVPNPTAQPYELQPEDVFDSLTSASKRYYVLIRAINSGSGRVREGEPGFDELARGLVLQSPGWDTWRVELALVGTQAQAMKRIDPAARLRARDRNVTDVSAGDSAPWTLRSTVENQYAKALHLAGLPQDLEGNSETGKLLEAAARMAEVGGTGKEDGAGWRMARDLLDRALLDGTTKASPADRTEVLERLAQALAATGEVGRRLTVLGELARMQPQSARHWEQLARLHLDFLRLPEEALAYADAAHKRDARIAALVRGEALAALGRHAEAIAAYEPVRRSLDGAIHLGDAYLKAGQAKKAGSQAETVLAGKELMPSAELLRGCAAYTLGDLPTARSAFERAASHPSTDANSVRAMACYDLGLTCLRLGEGDAAEMAFHACTRALEAGSPPGPSAVESVSPEFGLAVVAWGRQGPIALREVDTPLEDAPRTPALRLTRAVLLESEQDVVGALREVRRCLVLAPDCAYASSLCSELLARQALAAERTGAAAERVQGLAAEAIQMSRRAVAHSDGTTPFGKLLRQRDAALRGAGSQAARADVTGPERSALDERRDRDTALRLLRLAQRLGPDDRVISGLYARALLARYADRANEESVVGESVRHAQAILETYGKDPDFARTLPPAPAR